MQPVNRPVGKRFWPAGFLMRCYNAAMKRYQFSMRGMFYLAAFICLVAWHVPHESEQTVPRNAAFGGLFGLGYALYQSGKRR